MLKQICINVQTHDNTLFETVKPVLIDNMINMF